MSEQMMTVAELERQEFVQRARQQLYEVEQLFTDVAAWNENSRARQEGADPIDPDPDGSMAKLRASLRDFIARESAREVVRMQS